MLHEQTDAKAPSVPKVLGGAVQTHKVVLDAQPLGAFLLQEPLQQVPACVRYVGLEHGRLVQDVVVHLSGVATVEGRL